MKAPSHQFIKEIAAFRQKKARDEAGVILVEGRHPIEEALKAGLTMKELLALPHQAGSLPAMALPIEPIIVDEKNMARMASTDSPPPCLAIFERPATPQKLEGSFILVLDEIQDPGNLGTLIRSAIAFGADAVILTEGSVEPYNPKVIRGSAGLIFALPVLIKPHATLVDLLADSHWKIYATTGHSQAACYREVDYTGQCAIILGNEGRGVSERLLQDSLATLLTIPMAESVESLNVAISGSIILAEASARRKALEPTGRKD